MEIELAYQKAIKVIESCTTEDHLVGTQKYINLFSDRFKNHEDEKLLKLGLMNHWIWKSGFIIK